MSHQSSRAAARWAALLVVAFSPGVAIAQSAPASATSGALFTRRDLVLFAGATAGSFAASRVDVRIARAFADSAFHARHPGLTTAAKRASVVTETVLMIAGGTTWGVARLAHDPGVADVALHTTESVASAAMFIQVIRGALGRARPYVIEDDGEKRDSDPYEFQALHGFTSFNYRSFPSMHAMASFAAATALVQEMRVRNTAHRAVIAPMLYVGATMPSLARMYLDEHWTSDILMGAFLGVYSGQKVVQYSHAHPGNRVDRTFLAPAFHGSVSQSANGLTLTLRPF